MRGFIGFIKMGCRLSVWALIHGDSLKAFYFAWVLAWKTRNTPMAYGLVGICFKILEAVRKFIIEKER